MFTGSYCVSSHVLRVNICKAGVRISDMVTFPGQPSIGEGSVGNTYCDITLSSIVGVPLLKMCEHITCSEDKTAAL